MLKTVILTTKGNYEHRRWCQLGHLQTMGWPVTDERLLKICNGKFAGDYPNGDAVVSAIAKEFPRWRNVDGSKWDAIKIGDQVVHWNFLKILQGVVDDNETCLIIEDDAYFNISYDDLCNRWEDLKGVVGEGIIKVAMLYYANVERSRKLNPDGEFIDDFWMKGTKEGGQVANIYTPEGARHLIEEKNNPERYIESHLRAEGPYIDGFYTAIKPAAKHDAFWNFNSYFGQLHGSTSEKIVENEFDFYKGEDL